MQKVKIPVKINPAKSAHHQLSYDGYIEQSEFTRLGEALKALVGQIEVEIHCKEDHQGLVAICGNVKAKALVICQRCNDDLGLDLELSFAYSPIKMGAESEDLPERYDPVELDEDGEINIYSLLEDELILMVPIVPTHDEASCHYSEEALSFGEIDEQDEKPNPFDILKQLKKNS
ncbi:23S rRNA accumulation protein YceD [Pseudoalteromonas denitrificans]|uniref:Large ribosomal RNA subunit accumulation protein YceD n=1 Tax=Pseudoalteromonas denitrificans DSM 6059 TaxID=1123010 RepID=A0A1I1QH50_9GAMM|nr:23S rRNA accumulation protein YceD [Pseudoalteromonas denitrificans]SFD17440.1 uncharacterized protein SAMN02745724_03757 [Pseudoalteromonas denitrificans DSM 6059]